MELRSCGTTHFIQTIRGELVLRVHNVISHGSPAIRSKILQDVYESEDAKRLQKPPSGLVFDHKQVKHESQFFPLADRTIEEKKPETHEFAPSADDDLGSGSDYDTTLKQLKKRLLAKKRKCIPIGENSEQDNADEKVAQDESDLNEPLINWKPKLSKTSKAKRKRSNPCVISSSIIDIAIKSEENLVSQGSPQVGGETAPVTSVKVEVPDTEQVECQNKTSSGDASYVGYNEVLNPGQKMVLNEYNREPLVNEYENCLTNEISYDHLEDIQPSSILFPDDGMGVKLETLDSACREPPDVPPVEIEKQKEIQDSHSCRESFSEDTNSDLHIHSRSSSSVEDMPEERSMSGTQVPDMIIDGCTGLCQESNSVLFEDKIEADFPCEPHESPSPDMPNSPDKNRGSDLDSITLSKTQENLTFTEDTAADKEQPSTCSYDAVTSNDLNSEGLIEDELLNAVNKQNSAFAITGAENDSSLENRNCDSAGAILISEPHQPPERLLSTRKAFSPSSQEQLRLAMDSVEIGNDSDQNIVLECKEKLFEIQTVKKASSPRLDSQYDKVTVSHRQPGQVNQRKVIVSPRRITKNLQIAKGNLEGPRFSRTLPNLSTGCTSIQGCSESAIAFSQRQMHDMESIALKLMNELKSMKDIVEQKLLFEAYRSVSLKNDADEVKSVINNATKVEEMARRWMSMMARDCNRFCKIMEMTPDSSTASKDTSPKEKRKIMFADEAGGKLCHVKFFDDGISAPVSDAVEQ